MPIYSAKTTAIKTRTKYTKSRQVSNITKMRKTRKSMFMSMVANRGSSHKMERALDINQRTVTIWGLGSGAWSKWLQLLKSEVGCFIGSGYVCHYAGGWSFQTHSNFSPFYPRQTASLRSQRREGSHDGR